MKVLDFFTIAQVANSEGRFVPTTQQILIDRLNGLGDQKEYSSDLVLYGPENQGDFISLIRTIDDFGNQTSIGEAISNALLTGEENYLSPILSNPKRRTPYTDNERLLASSQIVPDNETIFRFSRVELITSLGQPLTAEEIVSNKFYQVLARDQELLRTYAYRFVNPGIIPIGGPAASFTKVFNQPRIKGILVDSAKNGTHLSTTVPMLSLIHI